MDLEEEGRIEIAEERDQARPRDSAPAGRQGEVEAQRVELGRSGALAPGPEVVMDVEEDYGVEHGANELGRPGTGEELECPILSMFMSVNASACGGYCWG